MRRVWPLVTTCALFACGPTPAAAPVPPAQDMRLYFLAREMATGAQYGVFAWSARDEAVRRISSAETEGLGIGGLAVSWDGSRLALKAGSRLILMKVDGSDRRELANPSSSGIQMSWSPDGAVIAADGGWLVPVDGSPPRRIVPGLAEWISDPSFGPDGRIVFTRAFYTHPPGRGVYLDSTNIYVVDADGANLRKIHGAYDLDATTWSPRGDWIAFRQSHRVPRHDGVHLIRPDGTGGRLIYGWASWRPAWSPDGRYLSFLCSTDLLGLPPPVREELCVGDVSGVAPRNVTNDALGEWISAWGWVP